MKFIIDRIEEGFAVAEINGKFANIPLLALPEDVCEGAVVEINVLCEETNEKEKNIKEKLNNLFNR